MQFFRRYRAYLKDNPEGYWFKAKRYGWGWTPATWQGFVVTFAYIAIILALAWTIDEDASDREVVFMLILPLLILTAAFIRIAYKTGERPRWYWGLPPEPGSSDSDSDFR